MPPKIVVTIDSQGRIEADFVAFPGCSCETAERRLRDELAQWGVIVKGESIPKTESQVLEELVQEEICRVKARRKISI
jgi:hypothetical protein|tara:strand:+ start:461 stop:694 length:234 start_codon:yes stop_codon:yes gene_type:complete